LQLLASFAKHDLQPSGILLPLEQRWLPSKVHDLQFVFYDEADDRRELHIVTHRIGTSGTLHNNKDLDSEICLYTGIIHLLLGFKTYGRVKKPDLIKLQICYVSESHTLLHLLKISVNTFHTNHNFLLT
jgi:hypothetical protein